MAEHPPVRFEPCEHPEEMLREAMLYEPHEAMFCMACQSLVFADGHAEPVEVTSTRRLKR